jgi:hypothetical protein
MDVLDGRLDALIRCIASVFEPTAQCRTSPAVQGAASDVQGTDRNKAPGARLRTAAAQ